MPPPHFTPASAAAAAAAAPPDLPKSLKATLKEAMRKSRALLLTTSSQSARSTAFRAIDALLADPALPAASDATSSSGGSSSSTATVKDSSSSAAAATTALQRNQIRTYVANKLNGELLDIFSDEMDQADVVKLSTLVEVLDHLSPLLGPACVVLEWWDVLLRPLLKNPNAKAMAATRARNLVVFAMRATPSTAYQDEPEPRPLWPPPTSDGDTPTPPRKKGDTPYPPSSTEPTTRKSLESSVSVERRVPGPSGPSTARGAGEQFRRFTQRIFDLYTSEASSASIGRRAEDEEAADEEEEEREDLDETGVSDVQPIDLVGTTWKGNLEAVLLTFGQDKPKEFFHHLAESFAEPNSRVPILLLLTIFLRINSIHTYHITSTALPRMLVLSAQLDTSTTSTALVITALVILLPHIPNWIANGGAGGLASLLAIYARIVDWRKLGVGWEHRTGTTEEAINARREKDEDFEEVDRLAKRLNARKELNWKRLESSFDTVASNPPDAVQFFTFVYGIFPCNVIRFLRAPIDYLLKAHFDSPFEGAWEDTLDEPTIQIRSAPVLRRHMLHPALVTLSAEKEVSDKQRWKDHDAADITAECISLVLGSWHESYDDERYFSAATLDRDRGASGASGGARSSTRQFSTRFRSRSASDGHASALSRAEMRGLLEQQQLYSNAQSSSSSSRRQSTTAQFSPSRNVRSSDLPSGTRTSADADEILSRYTSLRWGAPLNGTGALRSPENGSRAATWGAPSPFQQPHSTAPGLLTFSQSRPGNSAVATTHAASSSRFTPIGPSLRKGDVISTPSSPLTGGGRGRNRLRSGSLSSVLSLLPSAEAGSLLRHSHEHPLASSLLTATGVHSATASPVLRPVRSEVYTELAYLQRENLLLRNELNFELYLKEQHLRHIGRLHRDRIADTALEAERQNLYHTVRTLRAHLNATLATQERQRVEVGTTKARHAAWEGELNAKLKTYREERKVWTNESRELRAALEDANATVAQQAKLLEDAGVELFELRTRVEAEAVKLGAVHEYEKKIAQLTAALRFWDDDVRKADAQRKETELLLSRWHEMQLYLAASDQEILRVRDALDVQTARNQSLEASLAAVHQRIELLSSATASHVAPSASHTTSPRLTAQRSPASLAAAVAAREPPSLETQRLRAKVECLEAEMLELRFALEAQQSLAAYERTRKVALKEQREEMEQGVSLLSEVAQEHSLSRKSSNGDEAVQEALKHAEDNIVPIDLGTSQTAEPTEHESVDAKEA